MSVIRMSTISTPWSLIAFMTSLDVFQPNVIGSRPQSLVSTAGCRPEDCSRPSRRGTVVEFAVGVNSSLRVVRVRRSRAPRSDADGVVDRRDKDLPVADAIGLGGLLDRLDCPIDQGCPRPARSSPWAGNRRHTRRRDKVPYSLLPAKALDLGHGHAFQADLLQRLLHLIELERLDDSFDFFISLSLPSTNRKKIPCNPAISCEQGPCQGQSRRWTCSGRAATRSSCRDLPNT